MSSHLLNTSRDSDGDSLHHAAVMLDHALLEEIFPDIQSICLNWRHFLRVFFAKIHKYRVKEKNHMPASYLEGRDVASLFKTVFSLSCIVLSYERCLSETNCCSQVSYPKKIVASDGKHQQAVSYSCSVRRHYNEGLQAQAICLSLGLWFAFFLFFF